MAFKNKIRLPLYFPRPQFTVDADIYRQSDGKRRVTKSIVSKELSAKTEYMPSALHGRLVVALQHDLVTIINSTLNNGQETSIRINGGYEIGWIEFLDYPVAPAAFKAFDEGFIAVNSTCSTCDDLDQLEVNDDQFPGQLNEGAHYEINVANNDGICCAEPLFEIVSFDATHLENVQISQSGVLSFDVKAGVTSTGNAELVKYQVTCGEITKDAAVMGAIAGSVGPSCALPSGLSVAIAPDDPMPVGAHFDWDDAVVSGGWFWRLMRVEFGSPSVLVDEGNVAVSELDVNALEYSRAYRLFLSAICDEGNESGFVMITFTTPPEPEGDDEPAPATNVNLFIEQQSDNGDGTVTIAVRANTGGILFNEPVDISGSMQLFTTAGWMLVPFTLTIPAGASSGLSAALIVESGWIGEILDGSVSWDPTDVTEQGTGDPYTLTFTY